MAKTREKPTAPERPAAVGIQVRSKRSSGQRPASAQLSSCEEIQPEQRLSLGTLTLYALPQLGISFMFGMVILYLLKFSTDVLLVSPAAMGFIFGISRLWDGVADPMAGYLSDRTEARAGRRRPWMAASALPIAAVFIAIWSPPASLEGSALVPWMAGGIVLFYTATTAFVVPHTSLGAELTTSYEERNRVFAARVICENAGVFLAVAGISLLESAADARACALWLAIVSSLATAGLILGASARLRERRENRGRGGASPFAAFADVWRNPHARLLLVVFFVQELGFASLGTLLPYVSEYVLHTPGRTAQYFAACMIPATLSIPLWLWLSRRFEKRTLWIASTAVMGAGFGAVYLAGDGDWLYLTLLVVVIGASFGCSKMIAPSMQADVIDFDEHRTGERKEGTYFAAWGLASKAAGAISIALAGMVLEHSGFEPNVEQIDSTKVALRVLIAVVPAILYGGSALLLWRFRLNRKEHGEIRAALAARLHSA
jgi:GPH family glycoside/pentoside/hexuronide:cation symporter